MHVIIYSTASVNCKGYSLQLHKQCLQNNSGHGILLHMHIICLYYIQSL